MCFQRIHYKSQKGDFFIENGSQKGLCPFCNGFVEIDFKMPCLTLKDPSKNHFWKNKDYSPEEVIKTAIIIPNPVLIEDSQGKMVSFIGFLADQSEFKQRSKILQ
ncbi:MAG: hypothetical protein ABH800_00365 [Candidatus Nealsonbacteria bacterium]